MIETSLSAATVIYSCLSAVTVEHHKIAHAAFKEFSLKLRNFERALRDEVENEYWKSFVRNLKRYRFDVTAAPLGFGNPTVISADLIRNLQAHLTQCAMLYPQFAISSQEVLHSLEKLVEANDNPLLDYISGSNTFAPRQKLTVLLKEARLITMFEDVLDSRHLLNLIDVVAEGELRGNHCYDEILCIGPSQWFASYVFNAPRAPRIHVIQFDWIKDHRPESNVFVGSVKSRTVSWSEGRRTAEEKSYETETISKIDDDRSSKQLDVEELFPTLDLTQISNRLAHSSGSNIWQDEALARLFQLEGRSGVFLDDHEGASWLVIDLGVEAAARVKRIRVSSIEPGMYVLLREGGGGDYIVPVADKILGKVALHARELQRHWKSKLRDAIQMYGTYTVSMQLKRNGAVRANEANVRNWVSDRNIRTDDDRDFLAILRLIGLGDEAQKYRENAKLIDRAHRQAGAYIRKLLLRQVLTSDLRQLERLGHMKVEVSDSGGGQMIALRVVARSPTNNLVPVGHIGHLFDLEEESWRE